MAESRKEYIESLNRMRNSYQNQGYISINPSNDDGAVGNELSSFAYMQTPIPQVQTQNTQQAESTTKEKQSWGGWDKVIGFLDELAGQFGAGWVNAWEGGLDLVANGLGALGDATGWYDSSPFTDWAKRDLGQEASMWVRTYLTPWNNIKNMVTGDAFTQEYWDKNLKGFANVASLGNAFDNEVDLTATRDRYYGFNDGFDTPVGEFLGGAAHSIGFMLPSIMIGNFAGAGASAAGFGEKGVQLISQAASLGMMGVSATGKGAEEALNEGASAGQALAYGAASGGIEVASEIFVGKALGLVGLGTGKVMGVVGKGAAQKTASVGSKAFIKELGKTMFEEGMEEVFSAVMEPLTKGIYKGKVDVEGTYKNPSWWFGTDGHFNESVAGQFLSGAFVGGLSGGVQSGSVVKKVGMKGYNTVSAFRSLVEADAEMSELEKKGKTNTAKYQKAVQARAEAMDAFIQAENEFLKDSTQNQKKELAGMFTSKGALAEFAKALESEDVDSSVTEYLKAHRENISTHGRAQISNFFYSLQGKYGADVKLQFDTLKSNVNAQYDAKTKTITINDSILGKDGGKVLAHEYFGHAVASDLSAGAKIQFYKAITEADPSLLKRLAKNYPELERNSPKFREEAVANFLEEYFSQSNDAKQIAAINKVFGYRGMVDKILTAFDKTAKTQKGKILREYAKTLKEFVQKSGNDDILKAVVKDKAGLPLTKAESSLKTRFKNVFDVLSSAVTNKEAGVYASKVASDVDSEGNKLSAGQIEFFKDSKVVDENGNLMVVYHTTNEDFTAFDKSRRGSNTLVPDAQWGFFFATANDAKVQEQFGSKTKAYYLNITNPLDLALYKQIPTDTKYSDLNSEQKKVVDAIASISESSVEDVLESIGDIEAEMEFREALSYLGEVDVRLQKLGFDGIKDFLSYSTDGSKTPIYEYIAFEPNQIKSVDNKNPTANEDIRYSKKAEDIYEDHSDAVITDSSGQKYKVSAKLEEAISDMANDGNNIEDHFAGQNDDSDGYVSKRFVNRINRNASAILEELEARFGTDFDDVEAFVQDHSEQALDNLIKWVKENVSEGDLEGLQAIVDEIDNSEYPNDEAPDYENLSNLIERLEEMQNAAESWEEEWNKIKKEAEWRPTFDGQVAWYREKGERFTESRIYPLETSRSKIKDELAVNGMVLDAIYNGQTKEIETISKYGKLTGEDSYLSNLSEIELKDQESEEIANEQPSADVPSEKAEPEEYKINVSPYRSSDVNGKNIRLSRKLLGRRFVSQAERIAKALGIEISYRQGVGGFKSEIGRYAGQQVNELTYEFSVVTDDFDKAMLFAVLMKNLGHETQEAAIVKRFAKPGDFSNGSEYFFPIKGKYNDKIVALALKHGIKNYTYLDSDGSFYVQIIADVTEDAEKLADSLGDFVVDLQGEGLYDNERQGYRDREIQSEFVDGEVSRSVIKKARGADKGLQQGGSNLGDLLEQAERRLDVSEKIDPKNNRIKEIQEQNADIKTSDFEHEVKVDNGQTKTVLKETKASEPLFEVAKLSQEVADEEMEFAGGVLAKAAKSVGVDWDPVKKAQSFKKSVSSTADRLYRNIKAGKGFDVYKLHDRLRTTFIFNMSNVDKMERLVRSLAPYIIPNKGKILDIADTDLGYRGVHLNLKIQDIEVEVQLHSEASWAIKLQQDQYYDKWRSKTPTTAEEKAAFEQDRETSRNLNKKLGNIYYQIRKTAMRLNEEYTPTPPSTTPAAPKEYYKSIETTRDIVTETGNLISDYLGGGTKDYRVVFPKSFRGTGGKAFTKINAVKDVAKEAARLIDVVAEAYLEERNPDGTYSEVGIIDDILSPVEKVMLRSTVESIIKSAPDTEARSKATRTFEMQLNRALDSAKDKKGRIYRTRVLTNQRNAIRKMIDSYVEITDNLRSREGLYTLLQPFEQLHGAANDAFSLRGFKKNLNSALTWYTEETMSKDGQFNDIPFDPEVRQALIDVYESLPESESGHLSTESMRKASRAINLVRKLIRNMRAEYVAKIRPAIDQSYSVIASSSYAKRKNIISRLFRMYKRGFAPAYVVLNQMLGDNSVLANTLTFGMQKAVNDSQLYRGGYADAINKKIKELGLKKTFDKTRFEIAGKSLTADQAMFLYNALNVEANFDAIDDSGITYFDENGNLAKVSEIGKASELKAEVEAVLPDSYKKLAKFLLDTMNDSVKREYMKMYEDRYGKYEHRNEIGNVGDNSYWMLFRSYERMTNAERAVKNPAGMFSHALKRVRNENAVLIGGALSSFNGYIDQLAREIYIKPTYREALSMLNSKGSEGQNIMLLLAQKVDPQDIKYLRSTLSDLLGDNPFGKGNDVFSKAMSTFSVAKLSLNIGTMLKQFASIWTSNIPMRRSFKGFFSNMFKSPKVKAEYRALVDEIGGLKYRESEQGVLKANADSVWKFTEKIARAGMIGISKVDLFTVSTGVVSLMHIAEDQYGYEIGSEQNKQWVKDHWTEFELSQIGSGSLSKNAIQRGDYKQLPKLLFGFLQGANRAALGSQLNKIGLWQRNHKLDRSVLRDNLENARDRLADAEEAYQADPEDKDVSKAYTEARTAFIEAESKFKDFERYEVAGGKAIPVNMASGLIAQGIFVALINELMRHLKGKKDWDEWDLADLGLNIGLATAVDWMPFVNTISSMIQGYEVSVPAVEIVNEFVGILNSFKGGNATAGIRQIAILLGDATGIPVQTLYDYIYGAIKTFDPEMAYELKSVVYGSSLVSASKTLNKLADKGDVSGTAKMASLIISQYKTGSAPSSAVANEIARLEVAGFDAMPKAYIAQYTDDQGNVVHLTSAQAQAFKTYYAQADKAVLALMNTTEYRSATQEERANLIKKVYDAYHGYAKARVLKTKATKLSALLAGTNGAVSIGKFVAILSKISSIGATDRKTRKDLVFDYVNGRALTRMEKLLVLHLAGYSTTEANRTSLKAYLRSLGMSASNISDFMGDK